MTHQKDIEQVVGAFASMIAAVSKLKDEEIWYHMMRTRAKSRALLRTIHERQYTGLSISKDELDMIQQLGVDLLSDLIMVHDLGKLGIPDAILKKPGLYTDEERHVMEQHPLLGEEMVANQFTNTRRDHQVLKPMISALLFIVGAHHECWDGCGYPRQLRETAIPFLGRLTQLVDVQDALRHYRRYKGSWPPHKVHEFIQEKSGQVFDPVLTSIFLEIYEQIEEIDLLFQSDLLEDKPI